MKRAALVVSKPFAAVGVLFAGVALSACTSTGKTSSASVTAATTTVAYPALPETIVTVPSAYNAEMPAGGSIAEASAVQAINVAAAQPGSVPATAEASPAVLAGAAAPAAAEPAAVVLASAPASNDALAGVATASFAGPTPSQPAVPLQMASLGGADEIGDPTVIHAPEGRMGPDEVAARSSDLDALIARYADYYQVPEELVRHTVKRESTFNPKARNGPYWGLMQIRHDTARGMGYQGSASGLLDAETNLKYAVRYLRGAYLVAKGNIMKADKLYQRGYYYDAKRAGLLDETGLGKDRRRRNPS